MGMGIRAGLLAAMRGLEVGARLAIRPVVPKLAAAAFEQTPAISSAFSGPDLAAAGGAGRFVHITFNYNPGFSLADEYEAERVLKPFIEAGVREALGEEST